MGGPGAHPHPSLPPLTFSFPVPHQTLGGRFQADGRLKGDILPTGIVPSFMGEIEDNQIPFPRAKFNKPSAA